MGWSNNSGGRQTRTSICIDMQFQLIVITLRLTQHLDIYCSILEHDKNEIKFDIFFEGPSRQRTVLFGTTYCRSIKSIISLLPRNEYKRNAEICLFLIYVLLLPVTENLRHFKVECLRKLFVFAGHNPSPCPLHPDSRRTIMQN